MDPRTAWLLGLSLLAPGACLAAMTDSEARHLAELSLEDLMQVEVTTVAGTAQPRLASPAAVTVISGEDIRRAGHRTLAEALRLVPGMYVGRVNASSWIVGSRGMAASAITANRYLVVIDGRIAHDPLLSTTFWDSADRVVDDIDRIEVIRGPGATLWGQNAMNGVISVITRDARDTVGSVVRVGAGSNGRALVSLRQGNAIDGGAWRLWGKYSREGDFENAQGVSIEDQWSVLQGGLRLDQELRAGLTLTALAEGFTQPTAHYAVQVPVPGVHLQTRRETGHAQVDGGHLLMRLVQDGGDGTGWSLQAYHDRSQRQDARLGQERRSNNLDFRQWRPWSARNEAIWGLQYDQTSDDVAWSPVLQFTPGARTVQSVNAFVQNTTELLDERLWLMAGSKFTHHDFTGVHAQPSLRLWWTPDARQTFWAAVSRPVRVPSRFEEDGRLIFSYVDTGLITGRPATGVIVPLALEGNDDLPVEKLLAWEAGHRIQFGRLSFDTALFYNEYQRLVSVPRSIFGVLGSDATGTVYGADVAVTFQATADWRFDGSVSFIETDIRGPVLQFDEDGSPQHLAQLRSTWSFAPGWELHSAIYHVGEIPRLSIDAYERVDVGLTWHASERTEWTLRGQNLTDPAHPEASGAEVPRSVYAQLTLRL